VRAIRTHVTIYIAATPPTTRPSWTCTCILRFARIRFGTTVEPGSQANEPVLKAPDGLHRLATD
jgi:hypothetical protein